MKLGVKTFLGGVLIVIGFILSPLSWWNDLVVNVPIAYTVAWLASLAYRPLFVYAFIGAYWLTNIAGLIMMHRGYHLVRTEGEEHKYTKKELLQDLLIAIGYTAIIVVLIKLGMLRPFKEYLSMPL